MTTRRRDQVFDMALFALALFLLLWQGGPG
jgi:hypothetical protein